MSPPRLLTDEQAALASRLWGTTDMKSLDVLAQVNELRPGNPISLAQLRQVMRTMGVSRPPGWQSAAARLSSGSRGKRWSRKAAPPPAPEPVMLRAAPGVALPPVSRTWEQIVDAALRDRREIRTRDDLVRWNRALIARGEPPFAIRTERVG